MIDINNNKAQYLVLDLETYKMREDKTGLLRLFSFLSDEKFKTTEMWFRRIEPGTFIMGSAEDEIGRCGDFPQHAVTLTKPFYIGVFQVTQKQYELITGENPSIFKGDTRPVESVSYETIRGKEKGSSWPKSNEVDQKSFLGILRLKTKINFDLPTEAQWEYACRAGTQTALNNGKNLTDEWQCPNMAEVGRYGGNTFYDKGGYQYLATVGSYHPNSWGLYDMHGNVWEWCLDWYDTFNGPPNSDPKGAMTGIERVCRGGSWTSYADFCRSGCRSASAPDCADCNHGFRVVLVQEQNLLSTAALQRRK